MKAVMISIQPKWCELIASGKKTVEVRKTKPMLETPFKCYIYCTKSRKPYESFGVNGKPDECGGMVIGEFVCDEITYLGNISTDRWDLLQGSIHESHKRLVTGKACLSEEELLVYRGKYGWHISDLVIYSTPKSLREFARYSEDDIRPCAKEYGFCQHEYFDYQENCNACDIDFDGENCPYIKMKRPPQSWCYVEDLG